MKFLCQGYRKLSSDTRTERHIDTTELYTRRFAGGRKHLGIALARFFYKTERSNFIGVVFGLNTLNAADPRFLFEEPIGRVLLFFVFLL